LEDNENFMLTIDQSSLPTNVIHGNSGSATVTIVDNDGKQFHNWLNYYVIDCFFMLCPPYV